MTNVKGISPEAAVGKVDRRQPATPPTPEESKREKSGVESIPKDEIHVDKERRDEARLVDNARLLLDELPEVRSDKVELAKRRLEAGYYDRPEVLGKTAGKILDSESQEKAIPIKVDDGTGRKTTSGNLQEGERAEQIRRRLGSGYYEQAEILDETARRILKKNT